jgi:dTDP-4-dehydrorhamnose 3,5-epimerase
MRRRNVPHLVVTPQIRDHRGWFSESFHQQKMLDQGMSFVQDNQSYSRRIGTLRGFHFQLPPAAQSKLVYVMHGSILDIAMDVRRGSPTYGKHVAAELTSHSGQCFYIPIGFAHAFVTLSDDVLVMYKVSNYYAPHLEGGVRWNDPDVAFSWPYQDAEMTISDKDQKLPLLKEFDSPFTYEGDPLQPLTTTQPDRPKDVS